MADHIGGAGCRCWGCVQAWAQAQRELPRRVSSKVFTVEVGPKPDELLVNVRRLLVGALREREDGVTVDEPALLDQLAESVRPSGSFRGAGKGNGAPASIDAIDTWRELDTMARDINVKHGRSTRGTLGHLLSVWVKELRWGKRMDLVAESEKMIGKVLDLVAPQIPRRPVPYECPNCGAFWVWDAELAEGDEEKTYALSARDRHPETGRVLRPDEMDLACAACERVWVGGELRWVLQLLTNQWAGYTIGERVEAQA